MARPMRWRLLPIGAIALANLAATPATDVPASDWAKARVQGKYRVLLRQIKAPEDRESHTEFHDLGLRDSAEWKGRRDLPPAHWVYVFPYWYLWRDAAAAPAPKLPYHPDQAAGPPDTPTAGDQATAWASETPDGQAEWLELEYAEPVKASALKVYATCSPGAVTKVSIFRLDGSEEVAWSGKDPTPPYRPMGVSIFPIRVDDPIARVRLHINSPAFPGWNEIDAVGLVDAGGKTRWAVAASASSTFGQQNAMMLNRAGGGNGQVINFAAPPTPARVVSQSPSRTPAGEALARIEAEVRQTRKQCDELKKQLEASQGEIKALKAELESLKRKATVSGP